MVKRICSVSGSPFRCAKRRSPPSMMARGCIRAAPRSIGGGPYTSGTDAGGTAQKRARSNTTERQRGVVDADCMGRFQGRQEERVHGDGIDPLRGSTAADLPRLLARQVPTSNSSIPEQQSELHCEYGEGRLVLPINLLHRSPRWPSWRQRARLRCGDGELLYSRCRASPSTKLLPGGRRSSSTATERGRTTFLNKTNLQRIQAAGVSPCRR
jgi:hypothetical protein